MKLGQIASAALMLSGVAGVVAPLRVGSSLGVLATGPRGVAETRAGLGGTYAALGAWALFSRDPAAQRAVAATWLGAGIVRLATLLVDHPEPDWTFWAYLGAELGFGALSVRTGSTSTTASGGEPA